jgi:hypothetical protein
LDDYIDAEAAQKFPFAGKNKFLGQVEIFGMFDVMAFVPA